MWDIEIAPGASYTHPVSDNRTLSANLQFKGVMAFGLMDQILSIALSSSIRISLLSALIRMYLLSLKPHPIPLCGSFLLMYQQRLITLSILNVNVNSQASIQVSG